MRIVEETEHKTVAFDAYMAYSGLYLPRFFDIFHGSFYVLWFGLVGVFSALKKDKLLSRPRHLISALREILSMTFHFGPYLLRGLLPWHNPRCEGDKRCARNLSPGPLSDRIGRRTGLAIVLSVQIAAFLLFFSAQSQAGVYAGAAAFGIFDGGLTTLLPALVGDFLGRLYAGSITGFLFVGVGMRGAWGPMIADNLRDVSGNYQLAFLYSAFTGGVALLLPLLTPRPTVPRPPGISHTQTV